MKGKTPENFAGDRTLLRKRQLYWSAGDNKGVFGETMTRISQSGNRTETVERESL